MKTRIGIATLASLIAACGMVSCSDKDDWPVDNSGNAIKFGAVVPKSSRAASTTTTTINSFIVYGFTGGKLYMEDVKVSRSGASWHYTPLMYWPETPVNFYAYSPELTSIPSVDPDNLGSIPNYANYGQTDLLYSVSMNETAKESPVLLNFRHALSRVDVMLSCSNPNIYVKVAYVLLKECPCTARSPSRMRPHRRRSPKMWVRGLNLALHPTSCSFMRSPKAIMCVLLRHRPISPRVISM